MRGRTAILPFNQSVIPLRGATRPDDPSTIKPFRLIQPWHQQRANQWIAMNTNDHHKLVELLREFSTAMLITHDGDHHLRARPMAIADVEDSGKIWFVSGEDTAKVHEIEVDTHVHLALQKEGAIYLSINGMATLVHDRNKVHELWDNSFEIWFPEGMYDPSLVLIAVVPIDAEYWDNHGWQKVKTLVRAAKAYVTGKPTVSEEQQAVHGTLHL